jgi:hypothetical protein
MQCYVAHISQATSAIPSALRLRSLALTMPAEITYDTASFKMDGGSKVWKVTKNDFKTFDGRAFVQLKGSSYSLKKLLVEGMAIDVDDYSLANSAGMRALIQMRSDTHAAELLEAQSPGAALLFANINVGEQVDDANKPRSKRARLSKKDQATRDAMSKTLSITVPGVGGSEPMVVVVARPKTAADVLCCTFDALVLEHVMLFLRDELASGNLQTRAYGQSGHAGVWLKRGTGIGADCFVSSRGGEGAGEGEGNLTRHRWRTLDEAINAVHGDDVVGEGGPADPDGDASGEGDEGCECVADPYGDGAGEDYEGGEDMD